ncbi:MAG: 3-hydroxyacyl-CoA dehydrogenase family protein [Olegusella sp.]|nr:3-hydroxyacyl-CoA dehydrogenase family protein [Olegusella sp.]
MAAQRGLDRSRTILLTDSSTMMPSRFAEAIGMVPLRLNKEWPGYILNTLLIPWFTAALTLAAEGVSDPATIDETRVLDTGADLGQTPFHKLDKVGLPLAYTIFNNDPRASQEGTTQYKIAQYLKGYIDAGKTGIAVGEGFYKYE